MPIGLNICATGGRFTRNVRVSLNGEWGMGNGENLFYPIVSINQRAAR